MAALAALPDERSHEAVIAQLDLGAGAFFIFDQERICDLAARGLDTARQLETPS